MRNRISNILIFLGIILVLGAGGLTAYNIWDGIRAAKASSEIVEKLNIGEELIEALDFEPDGSSEMPVYTVELHRDPGDSFSGIDASGHGQMGLYQAQDQSLCILWQLQDQ